MAGLGDEPETGLLGGDGPFVDVFPAIVGETHRPPSVRQSIAAGSDVGGHVQRGSLEVVSHHVGDILDSEFPCRPDEKRHPVGKVLAGDVVVVVRSLLGHCHSVLLVGEDSVTEGVEGAPSPGVTGADRAEVVRAVGCAEVEILIGAFVEAHLPCEGDDIRGIEAVLRIVEREGGDPGLVGVGADVAVRNPPGNPDHALAEILSVPEVHTLSDKVHNPGFIPVRNREAFALGGVTIFIDQVHDDLDGLACRTRPLEGDVDEGAVVHHCCGVQKFLPSAPGRLGDDELMLVHVADGLVGVRDLGYAAHRPGGVPFSDVQKGAWLPVSCRMVVELAIKDMGVGCVGDYAGVVLAGSSGDDDVGAGLCAVPGHQGSGQHQERTEN